MRKLRMLIGFVGILSCAGCAHAEYPSASYLWDRLTKRRYRCKRTGVVKLKLVSFHTVSDAFENAMRRFKENGNGLGRLVDSNEFLCRDNFKEKYSGWNPEKELRKFNRYSPDAEFDKYFSDVKSNSEYKDWYKKCCFRIRRCEQILRSEGFWKEVLGDEFFNALVKQCNERLSDASVRLSVKGVSHKLVQYKCREITLNPECIMDSISDRLIYAVRLAQQHKEPNKNGDNNKKKIVTDFEINLRLSIDMTEEELLGARIFGDFIVNKPVCRFPYDYVIFSKNKEELLIMKEKEAEALKGSICIKVHDALIGTSTKVYNALIETSKKVYNAFSETSTKVYNAFSESSTKVYNAFKRE